MPKLDDRKRSRRRFLLVAGIIFGCLYAGVLWMQWAMLRKQAVTDAEEKARAVTKLLLEDLELRAPLSEVLSAKRPGDTAQYQKLDEEIRRRVRHFGLQNIKVYDRNGTILYAEDRKLIGENFSARSEVRLALSGQVASRVLSPREYFRSHGAASATSVVETYVPLGDGREPPYVFESYENFDPVRSRTRKLVALGGVSLAVLVALGLGAVALSYRRIHALEAHVEVLEGLLPICARCKKIRVRDAPSEEWVPVEEYFRARDRLAFTHGLCRECVDAALTKKRESMARRPPGEPARSA